MKLIKGLFKFGLGLIVVLFAISFFFNDNPERSSTSNPEPTAQQLAAMTPEQRAAQEAARARREELLRQPNAQREFLTVVNEAAAAYRAAGRDEFAQGATRPARRQAICATEVGRSLVVRDWVGQVTTRSTNSEGRGILAVSIGQNILLKTWNNSLSDIGSDTLIEPSSSVYNAMSSIRNGDWLRFSGRFFPSSNDCFMESSITFRGSMLSPEFIFRFESIQRIDVQ